MAEEQQQKHPRNQTEAERQAAARNMPKGKGTEGRTGEQDDSTTDRDSIRHENDESNTGGSRNED